MSKVTKNVLMGLVVVGLGGLAAWRLVATTAPADYPDTPASTTAWMCENCGNMMHLTAKQRNLWSHSKDHVRHGTGDGPMIPGSRQTVFKCEKCGEFGLVRARECPRHHEWYIVRDASGRLVGCPECIKEDGG